jgi:predicted ATPase
LGFALGFAVMFNQCRREWPAAQKHAEALIALSTEQGFALWMAMGTLWRGCALAEQGQVEEGIAQMRQGLAAFRATGAELLVSQTLGYLAEAYGKKGQTEEGLSVLTEALELVEQTDERYWEAELYRLKGEVLRNDECGMTLAPERSAGVNDELSPEGCFLRAIEVARRQEAKSLELRAVMSLSRLWREQGKREEARQMLAEIYGWFSEGFDTADLQEAKSLLEELSVSRSM